jgi:capsid protein
MRQVIHRKGFTLPGSPRGYSMFAPALLVMRQIQGLKEAHVAAKRAQAVNPIIYFTEDEKELSDSMKSRSRLGPNAALGPMSVLVAKYGVTDVKFMDPRFNGADFKEYLLTMYADLSAMWGLPWQVVRCEMGDSNLASARAGLDQADRTAETFGNEAENQVSRPMDEAIIRESVALGRLKFNTDDWAAIMDGRYSRPPKYSTDRKKDADTLAVLMTSAHVSPTDAQAMFGWNYEDQAEQTARDIEFALAQGLPDPTQKEQKPSQMQATDDNNDDDQNNDGKPAPVEGEEDEDEPPKASMLRRIYGKITGKNL